MNIQARDFQVVTMQPAEEDHPMGWVMAVFLFFTVMVEILLAVFLIWGGVHLISLLAVWLNLPHGCLV